MKFVNQLNALIINGDNDRFYFEKVHVQPLPLYQAIVDVHTEKRNIIKLHGQIMKLILSNLVKYFLNVYKLILIMC